MKSINSFPPLTSLVEIQRKNWKSPKPNQLVRCNNVSNSERLLAQQQARCDRTISFNGALIELENFQMDANSKGHKNFSDFPNAITIKIKSPESISFTASIICFQNINTRSVVAINSFTAPRFIRKLSLSRRASGCYQRLRISETRSLIKPSSLLCWCNAHRQSSRGGSVVMLEFSPPA